jgi:hypothetical protein
MSTTRSGTALTAVPGAKTSNHSGTVAAALAHRLTRSADGPTELAIVGVRPRLPLAQRSAMAGKVAILESRLFDAEDHPRKGLTGEVVRLLLDEINDLRYALGWLRVDLQHHHVWPADRAS